jgi:hypothetical protein
LGNFDALGQFALTIKAGDGGQSVLACLEDLTGNILADLTTSLHSRLTDK